MQILTMKEICINARKALENHTLQACSGRIGGCAYVDGIYRCVIGASLNDNTITSIQERNMNSLNVDDLFYNGIISFISKLEQDDASDLQELHDCWTCRTGVSRVEAQDKFLKRLGELEKIYSV